jgi:ABC-2 type transport system ATP-binding protein
MNTTTVPATAPPLPAAATAISIHGATKSFGPVHAVAPLDLDIATGAMVALLGPNGAGKSTTISMLLGLTDPDTGTITVCGRTPAAAVRSGRIAAMLQTAGLMPGVTITELLDLAARLYPKPLRVDAVLAMAGLESLARRRVDKLSGGQAQRVRFALAAIGNPDILVLDEPTTALDVAGRQAFWESMRAYAGSGHTVVFATHYLDEVTDNADRVVVMVRGRVAADGTPAAIRALNTASTVRFDLAPGSAPLPSLPGSAEVEVRGVHVTVRTTDPDAVVRALAAGAADWHDIAVAPASLDDSFLRLTRDPGATS